MMLGGRSNGYARDLSQRLPVSGHTSGAPTSAGKSDMLFGSTSLCTLVHKCKSSIHLLTMLLGIIVLGACVVFRKLVNRLGRFILDCSLAFSFLGSKECQQCGKPGMKLSW